MVSFSWQPKLNSCTRTQVQVSTSSQAAAALLGDGSVVTWGHADYGGDSSSVRNRLKRVQQVQAGFNSFAAILDDGSVVTWGNPILGGDSSAVQDQLYNVTHIQVVDLLMQITQGIMGLSYEGYSGSYT